MLPQKEVLNQIQKQILSIPIISEIKKVVFIRSMTKTPLLSAIYSTWTPTWKSSK